MGTERRLPRRKKAKSAQSTNATESSNSAPRIEMLNRVLGNQRTAHLLTNTQIRRDEESDSEKDSDDSKAYDKAKEKAIEAIAETAPVKTIIDHAKTEGAAFATTLHGALFTGTALSVLIAALHVNDTPLPFSELPIPLSKVDESLTDLELKIHYESDGSPLNPKNVMATLVYTPGKAAAEKEREKLAKEKQKQEIDALRQSNEAFRQMTMTPEQRQQEEMMLLEILNKVLNPTIPDLELSEDTSSDIEKEKPNLLKMRD